MSWMWWRAAAATTAANRSAAAGEEASRSRAHVAPAASSSAKSASMPAALSPQNSMKSYSDTAFPLAEAGEGYGIVGEADGDVGRGGLPGAGRGEVEALGRATATGWRSGRRRCSPASAVPASRATARVAAGTRRRWRRICPPSASARSAPASARVLHGQHVRDDGWCRDPAPAT